MLTPTASSGLPVDVTSASPSVCTTGGAHGATIAFVGVGQCQLDESQDGNTTYNAAPVVRENIDVVPAHATVHVAPAAVPVLRPSAESGRRRLGLGPRGNRRPNRDARRLYCLRAHDRIGRHHVAGRQLPAHGLRRALKSELHRDLRRRPDGHAGGRLARVRGSVARLDRKRDRNLGQRAAVGERHAGRGRTPRRPRQGEGGLPDLQVDVDRLHAGLPGPGGRGKRVRSRGDGDYAARRPLYGLRAHVKPRLLRRG